MNAVASASLPAGVEIELDGLAHTVPAGTTLAELVSRLGHADQAVATALNQSFVARPLRAQAVLQPGDQVLLFQPIVGG